MKQTPTSPARAHHRIMLSMVKANHKDDKVAPTPLELDRVASVFSLAGGSWERVFKGSLEDLNLLKKAIRVAVKDGVFTKTSDWE